MDELKDTDIANHLYRSKANQLKQAALKNSAAPQSGYLHKDMETAPVTFQATRNLDLTNYASFNEVDNPERIRDMNIHRLNKL